MAWRMPHELLDRSTRCHLRLRRRRAPRPRARELGTARASACVDGEALRHVGQPNVTASPRLAALARLKYHSNNSVSELSGERRANATGPGDSGPARFNSFCAENPFYHDRYCHISYQGRLRLQTSPEDYAVSRARLTITHVPLGNTLARGGSTKLGIRPWRTSCARRIVRESDTNRRAPGSGVKSPRAPRYWQIIAEK